MIVFSTGRKLLAILTITCALIGLFALSAAANNANDDEEPMRLIYFQNTDTAEVDAWVVDGFEVLDTIPIDRVPSLNWWVAAVHDVNGNGYPDMVLQNTFGRLVLWVMDESGLVEKLPYGEEFVNPNFSLTDLHDMNADGKVDAIFQNHLWGNRNVWFMDKAEKIDGRRFAVANKNWRIAGVNDMGNDGKINLIWEHTIRGERNYWTLDEKLDRIELESGNFDWTGPLWSIVAVHDMTGDKKPDLILQHTDGRRSMWVMGGNRGIVVQEKGLIDERDPAWTIVGAGTIGEFKVVTAVAELSALEVELGTTFEDLDLPEKVDVTLDDDAVIAARVDWSGAEEDYDGDTLGEYDLTGELILFPGVVNPGNLTAEITVEVVPPVVVPLFKLSLAASPAAGALNLAGAGDYKEGEVVTVTAYPNEGWEFVEWTGPNDFSTDTAELAWTMPAANVTLTARFSQIKFKVTLEVEPEGSGTVGGAGEFAPGDSVSIAAVAEEGWEFVDWAELDGDEYSTVSTESIYIFTMPHRDVVYRASFTEIITDVTAEELGVIITQVVPGVYNVSIPYKNVEARWPDINKNCRLILHVTGKANIILAYNAVQDSFFKAAVQGYTRDEINAAIVTPDCYVSAESLNVIVQDVVPGVYNVSIAMSDAKEQWPGIDEECTLLLSVGGKDPILLTYNAVQGAFFKAAVQGYTKDEIKAAGVILQCRPTAAQMDVKIEAVVPGVFNVSIAFDKAKEFFVELDFNSTLVLSVTGKEDIELTYNAVQQAFFKAAVQGYSEAEIEAAAVGVE